MSETQRKPKPAEWWQDTQNLAKSVEVLAVKDGYVTYRDPQLGKVVDPLDTFLEAFTYV